jgi:DNA modification methylase
VAEARVILGDALEALRGMEPGGVDALVCDPPAGIGFMGKTWDQPKGYGFKDGSNRIGEMPAEPRSRMSRNPVCQSCRKMKRGAKKCRCECPDFDTDRDGAMQMRWYRDVRRDFVSFLTPVMAECLRVCRPGAVALVWSLPRTSHWTGTALEDAGWQVEDKICHLFGTGFPKHRSKLKPAYEEWILCRKPGPKWLGVEEARVPGVVPVTTQGASSRVYGGGEGLCPDGLQTSNPSPAGRWPANLCLSHHESCRPRGATPGIEAAALADGVRLQPHPGGGWDCHPECPVRLLDEQAGERKSPSSYIRSAPNTATFHPQRHAGELQPGYGDRGGPSRFFYVAKAPRRERWFYCTDCDDAFEPGERDRHGHGHVDGDGKPDWKHLESHPTQKSLSLMRWLVKLACPAGGLVLDPFSGSSSTGVACVQTGRRFIGIDNNPTYHAIAERRLAATAASLPGEES